MKGKYKLTLFARFVIFLLLVSPVCYLAGNHFQSIDVDILDWKDKFNIDLSFDDTQSETEVKIDDFDDMKDEIDDLKEEIENLESELEKKDLIIRELKIISKEV